MQRPAPDDAHVWTALVLTAIAGAVDGAGFLGLSQQFVANQTGNAVLLAVSVSGDLTGRDDGLSPVGPLFSLFGFALGAMLASISSRRHVLTRFGVPFLLVAEVMVLCAAGLATGFTATSFEVAVALAAFAMGAQSIHASRIGLSGVNTTVLTGTLIALFVNLSAGRAGMGAAKLQAGVWGVYLVGAGLGSAMAHAFSFGVVCWTAAAVAAVLATAGFVEAHPGSPRH